MVDMNVGPVYSARVGMHDAVWMVDCAQSVQ
jgi:hypothetical protein